MKRISRRRFLQSSGVAAMFAATPELACSQVFGGAPHFDDYRALVCVFLFGGNDSFNMLVPRSAPEYRAYETFRQNLAIPKDQLLPITTPGTGGLLYGTHFAMSSLQQLFEAGSAAFVTNVGPLVEPTSRNQFLDKSVALPPRLFSHSDQQDQWNSLKGTRPSKTGWADRMTDVIRDNVVGQQMSIIASLLGKKLRQSADETVATADMVTTAIDDPARSPLTTVFPESQLGIQLQIVACLIAAREDLTMRRQLFFVAAGGFDTHHDQRADQPGLFADVSESLAAFYRATVELGIAENVTTFTQSDFGRTLASNGDGTDHGWGGNQVVLGGSVQGGRLYGRYPELKAGGPDDVGGGRFIPSTSADQYAATLARWFGIADADLEIVAPNLANFTVRDLGFLT